MMFNFQVMERREAGSRAVSPKAFRNGQRRMRTVEEDAEKQELTLFSSDMDTE